MYMKKIIAMFNVLLFLLSASGKIAEDAVEKRLVSFAYIGEEDME